MKKFFLYVMTAVILLTLTACSNGGPEPTPTPTPTPITSAAPRPTVSIDPDSAYAYAGGTSQSGLGRTITDYSKYYDQSLEIIDAFYVKLDELAESADVEAPERGFDMTEYAMSATLAGSDSAEAIAEDMGLELTESGSSYIFEGGGNKYECTFDATAVALRFVARKDGAVTEYFEFTYQGGNNYTLSTADRKLFLNYKNGEVRRLYYGVFKDEGTEAYSLDPERNTMLGQSGMTKTWVVMTDADKYKELWVFENDALTIDTWDYIDGAYVPRNS